MGDLVFTYLVFIFAAAYITRVMLYDPDALQPFTNMTAWIHEDDENVGWVGLFDRARRLFGAYRVECEDGWSIWRVYEPRMSVFRCPKCLSFWVSGSFVALFFARRLLDGLRCDFLSVAEFVVLHLAAAYLCAFLVYLIQTLEGE